VTPAGRGLVLLPAIAGVNEYIRGVRRRFELEGWAVETVDYFAGSAVPDLSTPQKILAAVEQVNDERVLEQTQAAVRRLQSRGAHEVGVIGYCIGGSYAMLAACTVEGIKAVANYYGGIRYAKPSPDKPVSPLEKAAAITVPMIAHYGMADRFVPPADVNALEAVLDETGCTFELFRYAGAPHAFDESSRPAYRPVASREAWSRTTAFLDWYVR
jgi:carboxymethylenebutenolidase